MPKVNSYWGKPCKTLCGKALTAYSAPINITNCTLERNPINEYGSVFFQSVYQTPENSY